VNVSLAVYEVRFDVPQAIVALVAFAFDRARVLKLAGSGRRKWHSMNLDQNLGSAGVS
jgi:hypothetical protein